MADCHFSLRRRERYRVADSHQDSHGISVRGVYPSGGVVAGGRRGGPVVSPGFPQPCRLGDSREPHSHVPGQRR